MKKIRVGVVGVGYLGQFHAEKYSGLPDVDLIGVADTDQDRANQIAEKLNTRAFADPMEFIGRVDAVSIVVPTVLHHRIAKLFIENSVHILIEKPVTATLEQADDLIALAARKGVIVQVGHIERFNPAVKVVRSMIKAPRYMIAERAAPFTIRCTDVSVVLDLMIHDLDVVMDLSGSVPKGVSAAGAAVITDEIDMATARIVFENGCVADVSASRVSDEKKRILRIFDGENVYFSDYQAQHVSVSRKGGSAAPEFITHTIATDRRDTLADEIQAFIKSVQGGTRPLVTGIEGRRALALATTITENIIEGITGFVPVP
jgi:predicted dehydrogenase